LSAAASRWSAATWSVAAATETRRAGARGTGRHDGYRCRLYVAGAVSRSVGPEAPSAVC